MDVGTHKTKEVKYFVLWNVPGDSRQHKKVFLASGNYMGLSGAEAALHLILSLRRDEATDIKWFSETFKTKRTIEEHEVEITFE